MTVSTLPSFSVDSLPTGARVLTLDGDFCGPACREALDQLWLLLEGSRVDLVIDLRGVTAVDADMIAELQLALRECEQQDRCAVLVRPNDRLWGTFQLSGMDRDCRSAGSLRDAFAVASPH